MTAMTVQCGVYVDFVRSYVEVVKSLSYYYRKLIGVEWSLLDAIGIHYAGCT